MICNTMRRFAKSKLTMPKFFAWNTQKPIRDINLLSSASRDRLIHVFNVNQDYSFVQTLDDHSSAITSVRFYQSQGNLQMVSCGADRSIIFRSATQNPQNEVFFSRGHNVAGKTTLYDMEVDHGQRHILTACQDRNIRVYNVNSGKHSKTFKGSAGDDGTLIKVVLDQSGIYAATSCTDKSICIYDYYSGECMATMFGHSEIVTGLRFSNDGKHLITVSGDGCVFIWSMPRDMTQIILARLAQQAERAERSQREGRKISSNSGQRIQTLDNEVFRSASEDSFNRNTLEDVEEPDYRFNVGQLPLWAKKQINDSKPKPPGSPSNNGGVAMDMPKGRWAQRLPNNPITFKSHYDTDSMVPYPSIDKRIDSESSKESSLEDNLQKQIPPQPPPRKNSSKQIISNKDFILSPPPPPPHENQHEITMGEDAFQKPNIHKGLSKRLGYPLTDDSDVSSLRVDDLTTDHDGDIEDYCEHDDESTEHSENTMYYPASQDTTNDFTVNAMDVEELRKSQRRHRKARPERPTDIPLASISGSQDSDDDEEVSTPSGEAAERNIMSMLSVSIENVDKLGRRETFLKKNFESLDGDSSRISKEIKNKNSISYKFNSRNREVTNSDKRQELLKRIEETRMKLKSDLVSSFFI
ncbi:Mitogen-activated protein kinase-binding protein 1 [Armadillidium vulgare]|nr:Mitogen-activated protein kinase-binding protein 1 [Armadillidium vulgare]